MKRFLDIFLASAVAFSLFACDDDKDMYLLSNLSESGLDLDQSSNIVISAKNLNKVVLQMSYLRDGHELYLTNDSAATTLNEGAYVLQISTAYDFSSNLNTIELTNGIKGANDIVYTGTELNILAQSLGLKTGAAGELFFRVGHAFNTSALSQAVFTEPVRITVTPIYIDMHYCTIEGDKVVLKNADGQPYKLFSPTENGVYQGFIPTTGGWFNFWAVDGIGQIWGNIGQDGNFAKIDMKSNAAWNFWTGEPKGCILINLDVNSGYISYTAISSLSLSGDAQANLAFDPSTCKWSGIIETTKDNSVVHLTGITQVNDNGTGANAADANVGTIAFLQSGDSLVVSSYAGDISIPTAGEYKFEVDLSHTKRVIKLSSMSGVKTYPDKVFAKAGSQNVEMTTSYSDGLADGRYSLRLQVSSPQQVSFVDDKGAEVIDAISLTEAGIFDIRIDVKSDRIEYEKVILYGERLFSYDKNDASYSTPIATFYSAVADGMPTGLYTGLLGGVNWFNYVLSDDNGTIYGSGTDTWDLNLFVRGSDHNYWIPSEKGEQMDYFMIFDAEKGTAAYDTVKTISLTGDFNNWSLSETMFTNNGDGTWTLKDVKLIAEPWGPYICLNNSWDLKLYLRDGTLCTSGDMIVKEEGTYDITIDTSKNSISVTKK
ncbi:MAG: DUF5114 domain-containing protein [Bacteroidales bacterium]|nr:DUF5114 domain-containing protein [Bacteroidales bacterium]